ncbi:hypothetical protein ACHHYP_12697 [Achlya hypogyna]|uniref:Uncharacterized protein n=1 Tax=Achlya hypogyna TaxID=1202772 RepID=A0A1V9ZGN1_ACHHY|nr:hypothetical protein ACHHYP_12697 [Achlya hypogyna]
MPSLEHVRRRALLIVAASAFFFSTSLVSVLQSSAAPSTTFFCSPTQLRTVAAFSSMSSNAAQVCVAGILELLTPTALDVSNRPVQGITSSSLNSFCTAACNDAIQALKVNVFPPCDTVIDGSVRSIGSVAMGLCPNGGNVATVPVASRPPNRTGNYCNYGQYDNMLRDLGFKDEPCGATAKAAMVPTMLANDITYIPFSNVTYEMINAVCTPQCKPLLAKIKAFTFPPCDTLINEETTLSLQDLALSLCNESNPFYHA